MIRQILPMLCRATISRCGSVSCRKRWESQEEGATIVEEEDPEKLQRRTVRKKMGRKRLKLRASTSPVAYSNCKTIVVLSKAEFRNKQKICQVK
jgi:hypothetical protein